jgi:hypothetical protein
MGWFMDQVNRFICYTNREPILKASLPLAPSCRNMIDSRTPIVRRKLHSVQIACQPPAQIRRILWMVTSGEGPDLAPIRLAVPLRKPAMRSLHPAYTLYHGIFGRVGPFVRFLIMISSQW